MTRFHSVAVATVLVIPIGVFLGMSGPARAEDELAARVDRSRQVYQELMKSPDRSVPAALLEDCKCIAIFPHVIKGAFVFGARHGKGVVSCRDSAGRWSPPAFFALTGGSWGFQIGAEASDVVLVFMNEHGARSLLESRFTLGGKAGVAAGPMGRTAEAGTDIKLDAEIYSYARSKGLFAGLSLEGARMAPDNDANQAYYGKPVETKAILFDHRVPRRPSEAATLMGALP